MILQHSAVPFDLSRCQILMDLAIGSCLGIATSKGKESPATIEYMISQTESPSPSPHRLSPDGGLTRAEPRYSRRSPCAVSHRGCKNKPSPLDPFKMLKASRFRYMDVYEPAEGNMFPSFGPIDHTKEHAELPAGR
jgi:hypothetical protein